MAEKSICAVEHCEKTAFKHGLCLNHSWRLERYGDPLGKMPKAKSGEPMRFITEVALNHVGSECLIWPFARNSDNGYPLVFKEGKIKLASRVVCELVHGPAPEVTDMAAHSCDNGHLGCINPLHLSWKSPQGNVDDAFNRNRVARGDRLPQTRLTEEDVRRIRSMKGPRDAVGALFGISGRYVTTIQGRKAWAWLA